MSPTERIAQTFPDINSQGLNTSGTAAGVRSFPQPFVGLASGVDVLIQRGSVFLGGSFDIPANPSSATFILSTPVDVTKSWIVDRGQNGVTNASIEQRWRLNGNFSGIVAGFASSVTWNRGIWPDPGSPTAPLPRASRITQFFTVVSHTGAGGTSADVNVVNCDFDMGVLGAASTGSCIVAGVGAPAGAPATGISFAELAKSFCYLRGIDYFPVPPALPSTNISIQVRPETWHGTLTLITTPGVETLIRYDRFYPGQITAPACGQGDLRVYVTAVMFI